MFSLLESHSHSKWGVKTAEMDLDVIILRFQRGVPVDPKWKKIHELPVSGLVTGLFQWPMIPLTWIQGKSSRRLKELLCQTLLMFLGFSRLLRSLMRFSSTAGKHKQNKRLRLGFMFWVNIILSELFEITEIIFFLFPLQLKSVSHLSCLFFFFFYDLKKIRDCKVWSWLSLPVHVPA